MMVRVLVSWALELPLFALVPDSGAHRNDDTAQVQVEPVGNVIQRAALDLLSHGELIRITTGIQGDSSHEQVGADHSGSENHKLVTLFECNDHADECSTRNNGPENCRFLSQLESVANGESKKSSSSATQESGTIFQGNGHKDSEEEAGEGTKSKDKPVDPIFTFVLHEKRIKDKQKNESG